MKNLSPGTGYIFKVRPVYATGKKGAFSHITQTLYTKPEQIQQMDPPVYVCIGAETISLECGKGDDRKFGAFTVAYKKIDDKDWTSERFSGSQSVIEIRNLSPKTKYTFKVKSDDDSNLSDFSEEILFETCINISHQLKEISGLPICRTPMEVYQLPLKTKHENKTEELAVYEMKTPGKPMFYKAKNKLSKNFPGMSVNYMSDDDQGTGKNIVKQTWCTSFSAEELFLYPNRWIWLPWLRRRLHVKCMVKYFLKALDFPFVYIFIVYIYTFFINGT